MSLGTLQFSTSVEGRVGIPGWSVVCQEVFSKTALRIFLILCMHVPYHKGKKRTWPFFQENSGSLIIHENRFRPFFFSILEARMDLILFGHGIIQALRHQLSQSEQVEID